MGHFLAVYNFVKKIENTFTDVKLRAPFTFKYKFPGQHICQRGDILSPTAPIFGIFQDLKRYQKSQKYDVIY